MPRILTGLTRAACALGVSAALCGAAGTAPARQRADPSAADPSAAVLASLAAPRTAASPHRTIRSRQLGRAVPAPRPHPTPPPPPGPSAAAAYAARILLLSNLERTRRGVPALRLVTCPDSYADRWAAHLAAVRVLVHQSMTGLLAGCSARSVGENIGAGAVSADRMVAMWMASAPHRANLLNRGFTAIGVGAEQGAGAWWAVQDFVQP